MISSKQFLRPLVLAAVLGAVFAVLPTAVDQGQLFGVGAAWAEGHSGGHGGTSDHDTAHGAPRNGGADAALAGGSTAHDISQGIDNDRARDRVECAWYDCH